MGCGLWGAKPPIQGPDFQNILRYTFSLISWLRCLKVKVLFSKGYEKVLNRKWAEIPRRFTGGQGHS